jgi:transposase
MRILPYRPLKNVIEDALAKIHEPSRAKMPASYRTQWLTKDGSVVEG